MAIFPLGMRTAQVMPALTAYAAALADVLPVEAQITARAPSPAACEIAMVMPRSLNEPVGFAPSYFSHTDAPTISLSVHAYTSGVPPSPRLTTGADGASGMRSRYSVITPRH